MSNSVLDPGVHGRAPLDEKLYHLEGEKLVFYQQQTGIYDEEALKQHIVQVQEEAYKSHPYPCIQFFAFLQLYISRWPAYPQLLRLGRERKSSIFIDIGCCFGNEIRKAIADGYPLQNVIATDLNADFWDLGHKLFKSTPETFPVPFLAGDVFDSEFLKLTDPLYTPSQDASPPLQSLTNLTPLNGHVSAIYSASFFHLFDEPKQLELAHRFAGLLSPLPGSLIFGIHIGLPEKGIILTEKISGIFAHSPDSWRELWDGVVFTKGTVKVDVELRKLQGREGDLLQRSLGERRWYILVWSVTRL